VIRLAATPEDFELCAEIYAEVEPEKRITAGHVAAADGASLLSGREGYAYVVRSSVEASALAMVRVRPSARGLGVGSALLAAAAEQAVRIGRARLWGSVYEGDADSLRFATSRGFDEVTREIEIRLCLDAADGGWAPGIVELAPEHLDGAYAVVVEATPETALPQVAAARPFEHWVEHEDRLRAVAVVAVDGGEVVGYACLYRMPGDRQRLENGLTAVKRSHRRRGIATAMKRAQIAWAREHGYREIHSSMVEGNAAMRAVNERLGYRRQPVSIVVEGWPA
jgi:mycothiol synthase